MEQLKEYRREIAEFKKELNVLKSFKKDTKEEIMEKTEK